VGPGVCGPAGVSAGATVTVGDSDAPGGGCVWGCEVAAGAIIGGEAREASGEAV